MKILYKYTTLVTLAFLFVRCDSELDIQPENVVVEEQALGSSEAIQGLVVGAYDQLSDNDLYGGWMQMTADLLGTNGDIRWAGTFLDPDEIYQKNMTAFNAQAEATWTEAYEAINICNTILDNLETVDEGSRSQVEGDARFIRGTVYFELVRLYAKDYNDGDASSNLGVPIKVNSTEILYEEEANFISRSTVADVYDLILEDLTTAIELLPEENAGTGLKDIFATSWTAKAMMARIRLQRLEFDQARILANDIIENGPFTLLLEVSNVFNRSDNSAEDIFAVQVTNQDGTNSLHSFYAARSLGGRRDIRIQAEHLDLYNSVDDRLVELIYTDGPRTLSGKYRNTFANVSIIRLAEMYLIRAEGNLLAGGTQVGPNSPQDDLNVLRARANTPLVSGGATIEDIMLERKLELSFEGQYLHDVRRRQSTITQLGTFSWNDDVLILPIPQREIDSNPALAGQQNAGY